MRSAFAATALAAALPLAFAQTSTDCDPTKKTCPADKGLSSSSYTADFTQGSSANASWSAAAYTTIDYGSDGAVFSISSASQAPTIETDFYLFFGRVDIVMRAAPGTGIVSSIVLESDDLDEIDWEFLGGMPNQAQTNFYGKGNTTTYDRGEYHNGITDIQNTFHKYTIDWTKDQIQWLIDDGVVRTLPYSSPLALGGANYPQTPMRLKLGSWCGGCSSSEGTVTWAGGETSFDNAPYNMYVKSVSVTNNNPACSYEYSDKTGSYQSITIKKDGCNVESGSGSSSSAAGTVTGTTATSAPTSSHEVVAISEQTGVVASTTVTGSAYSTNSAAISSLNAGNSLVTVTTTGGSSSPTGINATHSTGGAGPSATPSIEPSQGGASQVGLSAAAGVIALAVAFFL